MKSLIIGLFIAIVLIGCNNLLQAATTGNPVDPVLQALGGRSNSIIIVHLEQPTPEDLDYAGYTWFVGEVPHIMLRAPLSPHDMRFLCIFNHEYAHVVFGAWHGNKSDTTCGPSIGELELTY